MGFFDYRCMVSGLSLKPSRTTLVLLEKSGEDHIPIALPVFGQYNRSGAIDMIHENQNTNIILEYFQSKIDSGEIKVDWDEVYWEGEFLKKIENIEQLFAGVERGITMEYDCVTLNNHKIEFSLIDAGIWDEIIRFNAENSEAAKIYSATWTEIYSHPIADYENLLNQFKNAQAFLNKYNIKWSPPNDASQHYEEEISEYLTEAKSRFTNEPLIMEGILAYEMALEE